MNKVKQITNACVGPVDIPEYLRPDEPISFVMSINMNHEDMIIPGKKKYGIVFAARYGFNGKND